VELNQPVIAPARPLHGNVRGVYKQPPTRTSSRSTLTSLVRGWRSSSVSLSCPQIPPLDLGDEDTVWHSTAQFTSMQPSTSSDGSSRSSGLASIISTRRSSISTRRGPQSSVSTRLEHQQIERSPLLYIRYESAPPSPLNFALTTRAIVWKSGGQPRIITKATMEGLIHYLMLKPAGMRSMLLQVILIFLRTGACRR
jgi:hypothetical protein